MGSVLRLTTHAIAPCGVRFCKIACTELTSPSMWNRMNMTVNNFDLLEILIWDTPFFERKDMTMFNF